MSLQMTYEQYNEAPNCGYMNFFFLTLLERQ